MHFALVICGQLDNLSVTALFYPEAPDVNTVPRVLCILQNGRSSVAFVTCVTVCTSLFFMWQGDIKAGALLQPDEWLRTKENCSRVGGKVCNSQFRMAITHSNAWVAILYYVGGMRSERGAYWPHLTTMFM